MRTTHTFAELELSPTAYDEIRAKLEAAGYQHAFLESGAIDMHGIGITRENGPALACEGVVIGGKVFPTDHLMIDGRCARCGKPPKVSS